MSTEKKTRTPRNYESIVTGAMKLTLQERVALCGKLKESIKAEMTSRELQFKEAVKIAEGL